MFRRMAITMVPFQDGPAGKDFGQRLRVQMGYVRKDGGLPGRGGEPRARVPGDRGTLGGRAVVGTNSPHFSPIPCSRRSCFL